MARDEIDSQVRSWLEREVAAGRLSGKPTPAAKAGVARILIDALATLRPPRGANPTQLAA